MENLTNITFYKFVEIKNLKELKEQLDNFCENKVLKGKILLASEGITGYMSGSKDDIKLFEEYIHSFKDFDDMWFKHNPTNRLNSKRMIVKIRKETITMKKDYNYDNTGTHLEPEELDKWYENDEDFVIIDTRNDYEYEAGHFKNAIPLPIKEFTEFPKAMDDIKDKVKGKKIVTYCTGGIRCEKATAWMKDNGYEDVYQVNGGIINYGIKRGQSNWEGLCFVFDDRGAIPIDLKEQEEYLDKEKCSVCYIPNNDKHICPQCGIEFIMCPRCIPLMEDCCSKFCRNKMRDLKEGKIRSQLENYKEQLESNN